MASIEPKQSLSVESFSRNWLVNMTPTLEKSREGSFRASLDACDDSNSFIEMDPKLPPSQRFFRVPRDLTSFDFPVPSDSPLEEVVHADELICNGYLMPLVLKPLLKTNQDSDDNDDGACSSSNGSMLATPNSLLMDRTSTQVHGSGRMIRCASLKRLSKRMLSKYLDFLRPFFSKISGGPRARNGNRAKVSPAASTSSSRTSCAGYSPENWRRSCDSESSIYEAVLHCKRTIGN